MIFNVPLWNDPHFDPFPPPSGPSTQNFSFHSTEIFDFRVAAKKQRKNTTYYHHHLLFFGKSKTKNWKISVEFKMVKSLNTRFWTKKKDSILNSSIKKQTLSFTQKNTKKGQFNLLACKDSDVAKQKKKLKRKITKTPLYPRKKKRLRDKKK